MIRPCDRCGAKVADTVGTRQASLFDLDGDPRATDAARAELRAGRILCSACQRAGELFRAAQRTDGEPDGGPKDETTAEILEDLDNDAEGLPGEAHVDAALDVDAVADLDDEPGPTGQLLPTLDFDASEELARALWQIGADGPGPRIAWVGQIDKPGGWNHRARLDGAHRALDLAVQLYGGRVVR
ncbi:MAG: hypothetical protein WC565_09370 [Parcubacteria group bacterium]